MKPTKAPDADHATILHEAREAGHAHYPTAPQALLVEVARLAAEMYAVSKDSQIAFLQGYVEARRQHERVHGTPREE